MTMQALAEGTTLPISTAFAFFISFWKPKTGNLQKTNGLADPVMTEMSRQNKQKTYLPQS